MKENSPELNPHLYSQMISDKDDYVTNQLAGFFCSAQIEIMAGKEKLPKGCSFAAAVSLSM